MKPSHKHLELMDALHDSVVSMNRELNQLNKQPQTLESVERIADLKHMIESMKMGIRSMNQGELK